MKIVDLLCESHGNLSAHLLAMYHKGEGGIRFISYVNSIGVREFTRMSELAEKFSDPSRINRIREKPTIIIQIIDSMLRARDLPSVPLGVVRNNGEGLMSAHGELIDDLGSPPKFLFRYISSEEYQSIKYSGYMSPSEFYGRVHASYRPESRYKVSNGVLIAIKYDRTDGWQYKQARDNVYAVTSSRVSSDKIKIVR